MSRDVLFELGCEELPSASVLTLSEALAQNMSAVFASASIAHGKVLHFATPRRLAVLISSVDGMQPAQTIIKRGPGKAAGYQEDGQPSQALLGFARSCGVTPKELELVSTDKGDFWQHTIKTKGTPTEDLLPQLVTSALEALPIAKPMRWGDGDTAFARPVHWAVLLWGKKLIECDILHIKTQKSTRGHRFHHPKLIKLSSPDDYVAKLEQGFVIADFEKRRAIIKQQVLDLANQRGYQAIIPDDLLNEVTSIVEWPYALMVSFDVEFLNVPAEVLIAAMQQHQKCFALMDKQAALVPYFITVANIQSRDPEQVVKGNEKVMRARLSDAAFFFNQDKKHKLADFSSQTAQVIFQNILGSLQDKANRIGILLENWSRPLGLDEAQARRAAFLSKCDLMTGMVGEFPELQGLMGYYYARHDGEAPEVAIAIQEQYLPRFSKDNLPESPLGVALSLADRIDTLAGLFAINQKPTGVKDPFKLRRHALAVIRILIQYEWPFNLRTLIEQALDAYPDKVSKTSEIKLTLQHFILERLVAYYHDQGMSPDLLPAVRVCQQDSLVDLDKRMQALALFMQKPDAVNLIAASKRVNHLLKSAVFSEDLSYVDVALFQVPAEEKLFQQIVALEQQMDSYYASADYQAILKHLACFSQPVADFFANVMVNVEDNALKINRLRLLARLQYLLKGVADFSLLREN